MTYLILVLCFQSTIESEGVVKADLLKMRKKLEADIRELEISLDRVGRDNVELQTKIKNQSSTMREMSQQINFECDEKQKLKEILSRDTRTINILRKELEDANSLHSDADKSKRQASTALEEAKDILGGITKARDELIGHKRKLESSVAILETELEECRYELINSEDKTKRVMDDATKLTEDLKIEKERLLKEEFMRTKAEAMAKELKVVV